MAVCIMYGCSNETKKFTVCDNCKERVQVEKTEFVKKMELDGLCRFYLLKTPTGQQLVHKHQMIGKAFKLF